MLSLMFDKGLVDRDQTVRPQVYRAVVTRRSTQKKALRAVAKQVFEGSYKSVVLQALSERKHSKQELEEIGRLVEELKIERRMNMSNVEFLSSPLMTAIGWTIVQSIWQLPCWRLSWNITLRCVGHAQASLRYQLTMFALLFALLVPALTFFRVLPAQRAHSAMIANSPGSLPVSGDTRNEVISTEQAPGGTTRKPANEVTGDASFT